VGFAEEPPLAVDLEPSGVGPTTIDVESIPPPRLQVLFNYIDCVDETTWDGASDSDEMYYVLGLVGPDGEARGVKSDVFGDFDRGEARPAKGVPAYDQIWEGEITGDTYCVVVLMEHDYSNRAAVLRRFLSALEDSYADINAMSGDWDTAGAAGGGAVGGAAAVAGAALLGPLGVALGAAFGALFGWAISTMGDDMIGDPVVMLITKEDAAHWTRGPGYVWTEAFKGEGANYGLMFTFGERVRIGD
jgi:hypothetical protein